MNKPLRPQQFRTAATAVRRFMLLAAGIILCSCSTPIDGLKFHSLQITSRYNSPELIPAQNDLISKPAPADELLLKVEFSSGTDLSTLKDAFSIANNAYLCNRPKTHIRLALREIYLRNLRVYSGRTDNPRLLAIDEADAQTIYHLFLRVALEEHGPGQPPFESFDLSKEPEDVCIQVIGSVYLGSGYRSNLIVIPKEEIAMMLNSIPREILARRCVTKNVSYLPALGRACGSGETS